MSSIFVSVVIPVLRDSIELSELLEALLVEEPDPELEVIVVNGDASDRSIDSVQARFPSVCWVTSLSGRGRQMNVGAGLASGRWLLFLHADTRPTSGWLDAIRSIDMCNGTVGGVFRFVLSSPHSIARMIERGVDWRVRNLHLPYGDQGIFVRRTVFACLGGFRVMPLLEDVDFIGRLRRKGSFICSRIPITVSPRRWEQDGWVSRSALNIAIIILFSAGVSPLWLAGLYYRRKTVSASIDCCALLGERVAIPRIAVVIPALNEEDSISVVLAEIPAFVTDVIVVDNGSIGATRARARSAGARVVLELDRGYGAACQAGLAACDDQVEIVVFVNADCSDNPAEMARLIEPIVSGNAEFVIGDRGSQDRRWRDRLGNWICVTLINRLWDSDFRDLGPYRAIRRSALDRLDMQDRTRGWTIEMQVKAVEKGLSVIEIPAPHRPRIGQSEISGTLSGTLWAGRRMLRTIWMLRRTMTRRTGV